MKRIAIIIVLLIFSLGLILLLKASLPSTPQFIKLQSIGGLQNTEHISYDFLKPNPFQGGKMWIHVFAPGQRQDIFLYDIEARKVIGLLKDGWCEIRTGDQSLWLCAQMVSTSNPIRDRLAALLQKISFGRITLPRPPKDILEFWLLDAEKNSARSLGEIPGTPNFSIIASPDFHYAYTARHGTDGKLDVFLFDLKRGSINKVPIRDGVYGWWDNQHLLFESANHDFFLYDVTTTKTTPFITSTQLADFFQEQKISDDPTKARPFYIWNGQQNDFYFTDTHQKWLAAESYLIKVERPDAKLKLLSPHFKFEWSDHLDPTGRYYLYSGRESGKASNGVFLRDLLSGTTRILAAPDSSKYFSIPRFYHDSIIYIRSNALWQINLNGSNNIRLFPPS